MRARSHSRPRRGSTRGVFEPRWLPLLGLLLMITLVACPSFSQEHSPDWQTQVRKYAEAQDWNSAMRIVAREVARSPQDLDVRAWRARVLAWSGHLAEAEKEYVEILNVSRNDPDNWMGLAGVYSREGRAAETLRALDNAVELDPKRTDLHAARARALRATGQPWTPPRPKRAPGWPPSAAIQNTNCGSARTTTCLISRAPIATAGYAWHPSGRRNGARTSREVSTSARESTRESF